MAVAPDEQAVTSIITAKIVNANVIIFRFHNISLIYSCNSSYFPIVLEKVILINNELCYTNILLFNFSTSFHILVLF